MPTYYDIHCHVFNKDIIKPRLADMLLPLIKQIANGDNPKLVEALRRLKNTIEIIEQPTSGVFDHLDDAYGNDWVLTPLMFDLNFADDNDTTWEQNIAYTLRQGVVTKLIDYLAPILIRLGRQDPRVAEAIGGLEDPTLIKQLRDKNRDIFPEGNYQQQINDLVTLAGNPNNGGRVRPFFGIDPRRYKGNLNGKTAELIAEVKSRCIGPDALWAGVKLYAPAGFSPTDKLLYGTEHEKGGLYAFCEEHEIPLTVHCSQSGFACLAREVILNGHVNFHLLPGRDKVVYYDNRNYKFRTEFLSLKVGDAIHERAAALNHPKLWKLVLERFPNLRLNLAHFGNSDSIMDYLDRRLPEFLVEMKKRDFEELLEKFDAAGQGLIKSRFFMDNRKWKLNIGFEPMPAETAVAFERRQKLWDLLASKNVVDNWTFQILEIISDQRFPNAFSDLSCFTEMDENEDVDTIVAALQRFKTEFYDVQPDAIKQKILYGSDFWLCVMQGPELKQYVKDFKTVFGAEFDHIASAHPERFLGIA